MNEQSCLDGCPQPDLQPVKVILDTKDETEALCQCRNRRTYWFHRFLEIVKFDGPDDQTVWDSPITLEEAQRILLAEGRPDLTFLLTRPSLQKDERGVHGVSDQPDKPSYR